MIGPWKWSEDGCQLLDATGRSVLRIRPSDATQEEFDVIVAVPDLLVACQEALKSMTDYPLNVQASLRIILRDAIAKAKPS